MLTTVTDHSLNDCESSSKNYKYFYFNIKHNHNELPNAELAALCQNCRQETDNVHPETNLLDPTVTASGLSTLRPSQCSLSLNVQAASKRISATKVKHEHYKDSAHKHRFSEVKFNTNHHESKDFP